MARKVLTALLLLATMFAGRAAADVDEVRESIEASMLLEGTIEVDPQGRVAGFGIDQREKVPPFVLGMLEQVVPTWRFEQTFSEGVAAWVKTPMRLRMVAARVPGDREAVALRIESASFGAPGNYSKKRHSPPDYPREALRLGAGASVLLLVKVDSEGRVEDVVSEQVDLRYVAGEREMERIRGMFARAAERAAKRWEFTRPDDLDPGEAFWSARVPVDFTIGTQREPPTASGPPTCPGRDSGPRGSRPRRRVAAMRMPPEASIPSGPA